MDGLYHASNLIFLSEMLHIKVVLLIICMILYTVSCIMGVHLQFIWEIVFSSGDCTYAVLFYLATQMGFGYL